MPRYTSVYSDFLLCINEVETLRKMALDKQKKDFSGNVREIDALCRGAVVLLSSHIEAYIKNLGELASDSLISNGVDRSVLPPRFFYYLSKDYFDEIKDTNDPEKVSQKVFNFIDRDGAMWSRSGSFPLAIPMERFNKGFSNPSYSKIRSYFQRFGYSDFDADFKKNLKGDALLVSNMIDSLVSTRNKIAHGDSTTTITPVDIKEMIKLTQRFCRTTDGLFSTWWKLNYCTLR